MALVEALCAICGPRALAIQRVAASDVILGGARARLQLINWTKPERGGRIWVQRELKPQEQAFSIAHELGHFILHRGEGATPDCRDDAISEDADLQRLRVPLRDGRVEEYNPRARRELEANAFAAELLAPGYKTRNLFLASSSTDADRIAAAFGVSTRLAQARLVASVLSGAQAPIAPDVTPEGEPSPTLSDDERRALAVGLLDDLDDSQRAAARAPGPALVVAGPGTGKTKTLVGRVAYLYGERDARPETILALTFSNRAADEMRERLIAANLPGERIPVMTIHAFAAELLRGYASAVPHAADEPPLPQDFRILDRLDQLLLAEELLPKLELRRLRRLSDPAGPLPDLLNAFSRARDYLLTPEDYLELVEKMPRAPEPEEGEATPARHGKGAKKPPDGTYTTHQIEQARERAHAYKVWDRELRLRGLLDYGSLIQRTVELLHATPAALAEARLRFPHILVDEFQDTNHAAAELLFLLAGERGDGLWVVGDRNQSIYRWRGASPTVLPELTRRYHHLAVRTLCVSYRSVPDLVRLGSDMAARMAALSAPTGEIDEKLAEALRPIELTANRAATGAPAIWRGEGFPTPEAEREAIVADMRRRHEGGRAWGDMAALCYKGKYGRQLADALAARGVPVTMRGDFFARDEIKDALALLRLAASHDAGGLLRARGLLALMGERALSEEDGQALGRAVRNLANHKEFKFPWSLSDVTALRAVGTPEPLIEPLKKLGDAATTLWRTSGGISHQLSGALLRPRGLAWRLGRIAAGLDDPTGPGDPVGEPGSAPARASDALAALGALVSLAVRFDVRWATEPGFQRQLSGLAARDDEEGEEEEGEEEEDGASLPTPLADASLGEGSAASPLASAEARGPGGEATPRAARCFLRYIGALLRANDDVIIPPSEEDAVHILTIHGAKGLEFPIVYLHSLAPSGFLGGHSGPMDIATNGDARDEEEAERRCLVYVAATRARDALIVTRALSYGRNGKQESSLPAATILEASEVYASAGQLPAGDAAPAAPGDGDDEEDEEENEEGVSSLPAPLPDAALGEGSEASAAVKPVFTYYALAMYTDCPRRYRYREIYHLRDGIGPEVGAFHRFVRLGLDEQRRLRAERPDMTSEEARKALATLWDEQHGGRGAYHETYKTYALDLLDAEWERAGLDGGESRRLEMEIALRACVVQLNVDARIAPDPLGDWVILERLHTGRPNEDKHDKDPRLPLMLRGYRQMDPAARISVHLVYLGAPLGDVSAASTDDRRAAATRRHVVDVTERARQYADEYEAGHGRYRQLFKLDEAAQRIAAGRFEPRPSEHCATCPYAHICPGDLTE
ncbi:MAG TPA: UvrD-helicase domain-containing protein [Ktedonobacterales bacterium]|nr:UvrD-helicase domain-containing protein [Ktedonobacterales bacterium]